MTENRERASELAVRAQADINNRTSYGAAMATAQAMLAVHYDLVRIADAIEAHPHGVPIPSGSYGVDAGG